jgi:hypothetical protein
MRTFYWQGESCFLEGLHTHLTEMSYCFEK